MTSTTGNRPKADRQTGSMTTKHVPFQRFCAGTVFALVLLLAGCKSSGGDRQVPSTQSGLPEVTLEARPAKEIQAITRTFFLGRGYVETASQHAYELVFDKPTRSGSSR